MPARHDHQPENQDEDDAGEAVTVVLVHRASHPVTAGAVAAVRDGGSPPGGLHLMIVETGPGPPRPPGPAPDLPVRRVTARGVEIATARNRGAERASGPFLAFLSPDARPRAGWLAPLLDRFRADPSLACVAPVVAGRPVPTLSLTGLPGSSISHGSPPTAQAVLYPHAEAMVVRLDAFHAIGGFDPALSGGEEVDLGWRLWLAGYRVEQVATSEVELPPAATAAPKPPTTARRRIALATIAKNFDDATLAAALPAAIELARRSTRGQPLPDVDAVQTSVAQSREVVQSSRRRTDPELFPLFCPVLEPAAGDEALAGDYREVAEAFRLHERFGPRRRILVITPDVLSQRMAGPAIRAWQIAHALAAEHDVVLVTTTEVCEVKSPVVPVRKVSDEELQELDAWCDVLVLQGFVLESRPVLRDTGKVMVVDVYDPLHLEQLELERGADEDRRRITLLSSTRVLNDQLRRGDFLLCASPKQRDFWLGQLAGLARINPFTYDEDESLHSLISVVPFGLPDEPPIRTHRAVRGVIPGISDDDEVVLWGGGIYNWFDPLSLVLAVDRLRQRRPGVRLLFMGLRHPNPDIAEMRMATETRRLADRLGLTGSHVFFNEGWVPYDERQNFLLDADIGVSTHLDHVETEFSFRTRILDYLWAGLPIVATAGDAFADLIDAEGLGVTVPANDVAALEDALFRLLDDREFAAVCRKNLAAVRHRFTWSAVLSPLVEFCRHPRRAPDLVNPDMARSLGLGVVPPARREGGVRHDVRLAVGYLREGGLTRLVEKSRSRLSHRLARRG